MADKTPSNGMPKWVLEKVVPNAEAPVRSVHMLKEGGMRKSALLYTETGAFVAERRALGGIKVFEVPFPEGLVVNDSNCPHCGKVIRNPARKVAEVKGRAPKKGASAPADPPARAKDVGKSAPATKGPAKKATARKPAGKKAPAATVAVYPGAAEPVIDVEGIGPAYAKRLEAAGLKTTEELLRATPEAVATAAKASATQAAQWRAMAELMRVKDVGKQFAELLVRSDITSVKELAAQDPAKLLKRVKFAQAELDVNIQGASLNTKRVGGWIRNSKTMKAKRVPRS